MKRLLGGKGAGNYERFGDPGGGNRDLAREGLFRKACYEDGGHVL